MGNVGVNNRDAINIAACSLLTLSYLKLDQTYRNVFKKTKTGPLKLVFEF